jgi:hypothetical protein
MSPSTKYEIWYGVRSRAYLQNIKFGTELDHEHIYKILNLVRS